MGLVYLVIFVYLTVMVIYFLSQLLQISIFMVLVYLVLFGIFVYYLFVKEY
jgi:hypothetical protein